MTPSLQAQPWARGPVRVTFAWHQKNWSLPESAALAVACAAELVLPEVGFVQVREGRGSPGLGGLWWGGYQSERDGQRVSAREQLGFLCAGDVTEELQLGFKPAFKLCRIHRAPFCERRRKPWGACPLAGPVLAPPSSPPQHGPGPMPLNRFPRRTHGPGETLFGSGEALEKLGHFLQRPTAAWARGEAPAADGAVGPCSMPLYRSRRFGAVIPALKGLLPLPCAPVTLATADGGWIPSGIQATCPAGVWFAVCLDGVFSAISITGKPPPFLPRHFTSQTEGKRELL